MPRNAARNPRLSRHSSAAARCSAPGFGAAPKPNVAARGRPLIWSLGGGFAAPDGQPPGCLSPPDFRRAFRGARSAWLRGGPLALGDLVRSLPCAGGGCAAALGGSVPRGGARSGANCELQSDMRASASNDLRAARSRVQRVTSDNDSKCNVLARVPAPPVTYNHLI